jgi:hypothetical protein
VEKKVPYTYTVRSPRTVVMRVPLDPCGNPVPTSMPAAIQPTQAIAPAASARPAASPAVTAAPTLAPASAPNPTKTFSDRPTDAVPKAAEGWTSSNLDHKDVSTAASPQTGGTAAAQGVQRAEKPAENGGAVLKSIETIPTPTPATAPFPQPAFGATPATAAPAAAAPVPTVIEQPAIRLPTTPSPAAVPTVPAPSSAAPTGRSPTIAPLGPSVDPAPPAGGSRDVPAAETAGRLLRIVPPADVHST